MKESKKTNVALTIAKVMESVAALEVLGIMCVYAEDLSSIKAALILLGTAVVFLFISSAIKGIVRYRAEIFALRILIRAWLSINLHINTVTFSICKEAVESAGGYGKAYNQLIIRYHKFIAKEA